MWFLRHGRRKKRCQRHTPIDEKRRAPRIVILLREWREVGELGSQIVECGTSRLVRSGIAGVSDLPSQTKCAPPSLTLVPRVGVQSRTMGVRQTFLWPQRRCPPHSCPARRGFASVLRQKRSGCDAFAFTYKAERPGCEYALPGRHYLTTGWLAERDPQPRVRP